MFKLDLEKGRIIKKARKFQENIYFCVTDYTKAFVWITTNCGTILQRWKYQTTLPTSWEICMQVKKQQLELDIEHQAGSKLGKEYVKAVYCQSAYLTYMQSTSWEMSGWMKHKLESRCWEKYQLPQICRWHHPHGRKQRGTEEPLDEGEGQEWTSQLKTQC